MYQYALRKDIEKSCNGALGQLIAAKKMFDSGRCPFEVSNAFRAAAGNINSITSQQLAHLQRHKLSSIIYALKGHKLLSPSQRQSLDDIEDTLWKEKHDVLPKIFHRLKIMERELDEKSTNC